jgi:hypothetical protein
LPVSSFDDEIEIVPLPLALFADSLHGLDQSPIPWKKVR